MDEVDFLVIGSGSGLDVANVAANQGQSVGIVEKGPLGGTCLNRGCIPSKMLLYHADVMRTVRRADEFGIEVDVNGVEFEEFVHEINEDVSEDADSIRRGLQSSTQHTLYEGEARFVDDRTVEIESGPDESAKVRGETVLVAAGTRPSKPPIAGLDDVEYLTSTDALALESPPDELVIVGGGYIAAELGHFFGTFGSEVSIVGRRPALLPTADDDISEAFTERFRDRFDIYTGHTATAVSESSGAIAVEARPYEYGADGGVVEEAEGVTVTGDTLLVATGRTPNTDRLNVEAAGIETDENGFVQTDEYLRTTAEGVWALGDIVGEYLLKHTANHEAQTVMRNFFGDELEPVEYSAMPFAVFTEPEVAGVGATEAELQAADREYATRTYPYEETARGQAMHAEGFVKAIIDLDGEILGCHIIGPEASDLVQEVVVAMTAGSKTVQDVRDAVHIHPALSEVVQRAFAGQFTRGDEHTHQH
jgi:dihydrolipoamide dehydrogenase